MLKNVANTQFYWYNMQSMQLCGVFVCVCLCGCVKQDKWSIWTKTFAQCSLSTQLMVDIDIVDLLIHIQFDVSSMPFLNAPRTVAVPAKQFSCCKMRKTDSIKYLKSSANLIAFFMCSTWATSEWMRERKIESIEQWARIAHLIAAYIYTKSKLIGIFNEENTICNFWIGLFFRWCWCC